MRVKAYVLIIIIAVALGLVYFLKSSDYSPNKVVLNKNMSKVVKLDTKDGFEIIGDYYEADSDKGVLLLHMMPADRKSWTKFAEKLQANNFKVLAIDIGVISSFLPQIIKVS